MSDKIQVINYTDNYFRISNYIFEKGLDCYELAVYCYLCRLSNNDSRKSFPSLSKIAEKTKISRRKVSEIINNLVEKEVIHKIKGYNTSNNYVLLPVIPSKKHIIDSAQSAIGSAQCAPASAPDALPLVHEVPSINTNIIKTNNIKTNHKDTALFLANKILEINPNFRELQKGKYNTTIDRWSDDIRKMNEIDKRSINEIKTVIDYAMNNDFWKSNILSGKKLREKYDTLFMRIKSDKSYTMPEFEKSFNQKLKDGEIIKKIKDEYFVNIGNDDYRKIEVHQIPKCEQEYLDLVALKKQEVTQ